MNKRIKGLIDQCTYLSTTYINGIDESTEEFDKEMFAALIIKECVDKCRTDWYGDSLDNICAKMFKHFRIKD